MVIPNARMVIPNARKNKGLEIESCGAAIVLRIGDCFLSDGMVSRVVSACAFDVCSWTSNNLAVYPFSCLSFLAGGDPELHMILL